MDSDLSGVGLVQKCRVAQNTFHLIIIDKRAHCIMPRSFYIFFLYLHFSAIPLGVGEGLP